MRLVTLGLVALVAAVGCGSASSAPAESTVAAPATSLTISFWPSGADDGPMRRWTLRCGPAGGSHPGAAAACTRLARVSAPFAPLRDDVACIQIYGGPQQALVAGTYKGRRIRSELSLRDGCQIDRFKKLEFLVPGFRVSNAGSGS